MEVSPWSTQESGSPRAEPVPSGWGGRSEAPQRGLERIVTLDIVPKLVRAQRIEPVVVARLPLLAPGGDVIEDFAQIVLTGREIGIREFMERVRGEGSSLESLYLDLLTPVARRFGEMWEEDLVQFTEVTLGLMRLQGILRAYSEDFQNQVPHRDIGRQALVASLPGEQHNFGLAMVGEFLARAGWSIAGGPGLGTDEMVRLVRSHAFTLVGLSVSCEARLEPARRAIRSIREASTNRAIRIMVGGQVFFDHPEFVGEIGGDTTAPDALQAAVEAEGLLSRLRGHP